MKLHQMIMSLLLLFLSAQVYHVSAFWTVDCGIIAREVSDPIRFPGEISSHTNVVAGSSSFGPLSTNIDLRNGSCTSCDVKQDKSAYWTPQLYVVPPELVGQTEDEILAGDGMQVPNVDGNSFIIYYKLITRTGEKSNNDPFAWEKIVPFPEDFRLLVTEKMILDKTLTASNVYHRPLSYKCLGFGNQMDTVNFPEDPRLCKYGMRAQLTFPSCWDGVKSQTIDNSHMAYPKGSWAGSSCPDSHPVRVPTLFIEVVYNTRAVADKLNQGWKLSFPKMEDQYISSNEPLFLAGFMNGWDQEFLQQALDNCGITPCSFVEKKYTSCNRDSVPAPTSQPTRTPSPTKSSPATTMPPPTMPPPSSTPIQIPPSKSIEAVQMIYKLQNGNLKIQYHTISEQGDAEKELLAQLYENSEWTFGPSDYNELPDELAVFTGLKDADNQYTAVGQWVEGPQIPSEYLVKKTTIVNEGENGIQNPSPTTAPSPTGSPVENSCGDGWRVLFEDNFENFDESKWSFQMYDGWQYNIGGWGNNEKQWYTNRSVNADVSNGKLVINARKESNTEFIWQNCWEECRERCSSLGNTGENLQYCIDSCGWPRCGDVRDRAITSARLRTSGKFSISPSSEYESIRVESSISISKSPGLFPAFWMLPEEGATADCSGCGSYGQWPLSGEIDLMESYNNMSEVLGTIHFGDSWPYNKYISSATKMPDEGGTEESTGFQLYGFEWSRSSMKWLLNGREYGSLTSNQWYTTGKDKEGSEPSSDAPFDKNFHLLMNLAVGGNLPEIKYQQATGKSLDLSTIQDALGEDGKQMLVDYVRVCGKFAASEKRNV